MDIKEWFDGLDKDVQDKVKECKTMEELNDLLTEEGIDLSDELLQSIAGGGHSDSCPPYYVCPLYYAN